MTTKVETTAEIQIDPIPAETIIVPVVGTAPLIMNKMSEKAKRMMRDRAAGRQTPKEPNDPEAEFKAASHKLVNGGGYGFPAVAFKSATVGAARFYGKQVTMTALKQFMWFHGEQGEPGSMALIPISGPDNGDEWPIMREDPVPIGRGMALRYRPAFWPWGAELKITFVTSMLSRGSVVSLIDAGGMGIGVGEWRQTRNGDFGTFRVDIDREVKVVESPSD